MASEKIKIQIEQNRRGDWFGNIVGKNGEPMYTQEGVKNLQDAIDTARSLRKDGLDCEIIVDGNEYTE